MALAKVLGPLRQYAPKIAAPKGKGSPTKLDLDKAKPKIDAGLTGIGASELIKELLQAKEDAKNTPASESLEAPF